MKTTAIFLLSQLLYCVPRNEWIGIVNAYHRSFGGKQMREIFTEYLQTISSIHTESDRDCNTEIEFLSQYLT